jgi:hypothetical protein
VPRTSLASSIKEDSSPQLVKVDKPKKKEPKKKNDDFSKSMSFTSMRKM